MTPSLNTLQFVQRSGLIELSWGQPDLDLLPVADTRRAAVRALELSGPETLAYGANRGAGPLVAWLQNRIAEAEGQSVSAEEIVITGGASEALDQLGALFTRPGDVVLAESPAYHLALQIMRDRGLELIPIPVDEDGLRMDVLRARVSELKQAGRPPRWLYTIPTFQNPTGACLSLERRQALIEYAAAENLLLVEDDVYRELAYDHAAPPSLWGLAPRGAVARLGSFSKSLAPGLRVGWITAEPSLVQRMVDGGLRNSGGGMNHFAAMTAAAFCAEGFFTQQVARLHEAYRSRRDALSDALAEHLPPGCTWNTPAGGFFIWVALPEDVDAAALLPVAEAHGVTYVPGSRFYIEGGGRNRLRLAFSVYGPGELAEGARRLGQALREYQAALPEG